MEDIGKKIFLLCKAISTFSEAHATIGKQFLAECRFITAFSPIGRVFILFIAILLIILRFAVQDNLDRVSLSWISVLARSSAGNKDGSWSCG